MQKDMHFYGTYAVARIAGFKPGDAKIIATAAEFVDEAVAATPINLGNQRYMLPVVSAHKMLELGKNCDEMDQWKVWVPFHFLPGGRGETVEERLMCQWGDPGNVATDAIIDLALEAGEKNKPYALHLLGIVTHVIQDTYAHYGFSGIASDLNKIDQTTLKPLNASDGIMDHITDKFDKCWDRLAGSFADATRLGHAGASTCPDRPYLKWEFTTEEGQASGVRDNPDSFYKACTRLHAIYQAFIENKPSMQDRAGHLEFEDKVAKEIKAIIAEEGPGDDRGEYWRDRIVSSALYTVDKEEMSLKYDIKDWRVKAMLDATVASNTEAHKFNWAASKYLNTVHDDILPELKILLD